MAWRYAFGFLSRLGGVFFLVEWAVVSQENKKGKEVTDGLNVSNNSVENIISQGRFEYLAYT